MLKPRILALSVSLTLALVGCGGSVGDNDDTNSAEVRAGQCPSGTTVPGIDISSWQGTINWSSVKTSGQKFVIVRVGDGTYIDPDFARNWAGAKATGLIHGVYQYFEPGEDPTTQANIVIARVGKLGTGELPVMLDVEATGGQSRSTITSRIHTWVSAIEKGTGKTPFIYTGAYFWDDNVASSDFHTLPLDVAWYGTNCPGTPNAWTHWTMHQYSSSGRVSGISGNVDMDVFNGTLAELEQWAGEGAAQAPAILESLSARVVPNADGRIEIFVRGTNGHVYTVTQVAGGWSGWIDLNGSVDSEPTGLLDHEKRIELYVVGSNGEAYTKAQTAANSEFATSWTGLGGVFKSTLAPVLNQDGRVEVFGVGTNNQLYHAWQQGAPGGAFTGWTALGGTLASSPTAVRNADGRIEVFALFSDNAVHHIFQTAPGGGWSDWATLGGGLTSAPAVVLDGAGHLELFARGGGDVPYHRTQQADGTWTDWASLGGQLSSQVSAVVDESGHVEVFGRGMNDELYHLYQSTPGGSFSAWQSLGGKLSSSPSAGVNKDGRIEVFSLTGTTTEHTWQTAAAGEAWSAWSSLGGTLNGF